MRLRSEGSSPTISTLKVAGIDRASILGGPWLADKVDLDLTGVLPLGDGRWHTITLTPTGQGQKVGGERRSDQAEQEVEYQVDDDK